MWLDQPASWGRQLALLLMAGRAAVSGEGGGEKRGGGGLADNGWLVAVTRQPQWSSGKDVPVGLFSPLGRVFMGLPPPPPPG